MDPQVASEPVRLPSQTTTEHILTNSETHQSYLIQISWPLNLSKSLALRQNKLPVVYVLDGNAYFLTASEICWRRETSPFWYGGGIIVGIGYPHDPGATGSLYDLTRRCFDLTPPDSITTLRDDGQKWFGGSDIFLEFVQNKVRPFVRQQFPQIEISKEAILGHSFGGLCALRALFTKKGGLFDAYLAISPSIWWNDESILGEEAVFCQGGNVKIGSVKEAYAPLLELSYGSLEEEPVRGRGESEEKFEERRCVARDRKMGTHIRDMSERLKENGKLKRIRLTQFDDEDHGTAATVGLLRYLTRFFEQD